MLPAAESRLLLLLLLLPPLLHLLGSWAPTTLEGARCRSAGACATLSFRLVPACLCLTLKEVRD